MRKNLILMTSVAILISVLTPSSARGLEPAEKVLVLREAKEERGGAVAVEVYLIGDILEAKVSVRMPKARPKIENVILIGPKIGRMSPVEIKQIFATMEEEPLYQTTKRGGFISFDEKTKTKELKGAVVRKLFKFKISREDIIPDGHYQLWVRSKEEGSHKRGKKLSYRFDLEKLPQLIK